MCTSSTATPAATGGSAVGEDERNASAGRRRLPPAASALAPTSAHQARVALDRASELGLDLGEVVVEAGGRADDLERGHGLTPTCSATMPPPRSR